MRCKIQCCVTRQRAIVCKAIFRTFQNFIVENEKLCKPDNVHICDGSIEENKKLLDEMQKDGEIKKLTKYENWSVEVFCIFV